MLYNKIRYAYSLLNSLADKNPKLETDKYNQFVNKIKTDEAKLNKVIKELENLLLNCM